MAVQLIEGFESGAGGYATFASNIIGSRTTAGPWSNYALQGNPAQWRQSLKNPTNASDIYVAFRYLLPGQANPLVQFYDTIGNGMGFLRLSAGLTLQIYDYASNLRATGTTVLTANVWHLVEVHFVVHATLGSVDVRIDGLSTSEVSFSSFPTKPATTNVGSILFIGNGLDDLIVYDSTGAQNNTWVGDKGIYGLYPSAAGDANDFDPDGKSAAVTRWYFPRPDVKDNTTNYGYLSALQNLAPSSSWEVTTPVNGVIYRGELADQKRGSGPTSADDNNNGMTSLSGSSTVWNHANGDDVLMAQYVSPPLAAQTISGTFKMYLQTSEPNSTLDYRSQIIIRVVSNDGSIVRGTLYAGDTATTGPNPPSEWNTSTQTRAFPRAGLLPAALSSLAISAGDRVVVEFGFRAGAAGTNADLRFRLGDNGSGGDLPEDETQTAATFIPWIEFSGGLVLSPVGNYGFVDDGYSTGPLGLDPTGALPKPIDNDATYVSTSVDNERDLYQLTNLGPSYSVAGPIAIKSYVKKLDSGNRSLTHVYKTTGAEQTDGPIAITTSYAGKQSLLDVDATDGAAWTDAKVNALQAGPKATT
jgi:hypothetical protein